MSADTDSTRSAADDAAAAPLDLLLTDAATGMLRRVNPGGSGLRLAAALAARPRLVAGRGGAAGRRAGPHRRGPLPGAAVPAGPPVRRPGLEGQPAAEPGGGQGRARHRRRQRPGGPAAFPRRHGGSAAGAVHGRAGRVRSRGGPGRHAWVGGPADPGVRADPVPSGHARGPAGPAADRPAGDQQVLRDGPGPRPEHGGVPGRPGPAGVHDLLAQPGRRHAKWDLDT
jgi:collagen type IV alpha